MRHSPLGLDATDSLTLSFSVKMVHNTRDSIANGRASSPSYCLAVLYNQLKSKIPQNNPAFSSQPGPRPALK